MARMQYSRTGIVAVLVAVEIFIAGAILWTLHGGPGGPYSAQASGLHRASYQPHQFDPIDAGSAPNVTVDDPDSGITVSVSTDGMVHVTDQSRIEGWIWGNSHLDQLDVRRTADGVSITRPQSNGNFGFQMIGWQQQHVDIAVPESASIDVRRCSGADVSGIAGSVRVHSVDGHVAVNDLRGDAELSSEDGRIEAYGVHAKHLAMSTSDGRLLLRDVTVDTLQGTTQDGSIRGSAVQAAGGNLTTSDGSITLGLGNADALTLRAHTGDGHIDFNGRRSNRDGDSSDAEWGTGAGTLAVSTDDGSIHITTNGAQ